MKRLKMKEKTKQTAQQNKLWGSNFIMHSDPVVMKTNENPL